MSDPRIKKFGLAGFNKPKRTPNHPKKSHVVLAKEGDRVKLIRFGMQGAKNKPKSNGHKSDILILKSYALIYVRRNQRGGYATNTKQHRS